MSTSRICSVFFADAEDGWPNSPTPPVSPNTSMQEDPFCITQTSMGSLSRGLIAHSSPVGPQEVIHGIIDASSTELDQSMVAEDCLEQSNRSLSILERRFFRRQQQDFLSSIEAPPYRNSIGHSLRLRLSDPLSSLEEPLNGSNTTANELDEATTSFESMHVQSSSESGLSAASPHLQAGELTAFLCGLWGGVEFLDRPCFGALEDCSPVVTHSILVPILRKCRTLNQRPMLDQALMSSVLKTWGIRNLKGFGYLTKPISKWLLCTALLEGLIKNSPETSEHAACADYFLQLHTIKPNLRLFLSRIGPAQHRLNFFENHSELFLDNWQRVSPLLSIGRTTSSLQLDWLCTLPAEAVQRLSIIATSQLLIRSSIDWEESYERLEDSAFLTELSMILSRETSTWLHEKGLSPIEILTHLVQHPLIILRQARIDLSHLETTTADVIEKMMCYPWPFFALSQVWPDCGSEISSLSYIQILNLIDHAWTLQRTGSDSSSVYEISRCFAPQFLHSMDEDSREPTDLCTPDTALKKANQQYS